MTESEVQLLYIDKPHELDELCRRLRGTPWLALDTEFLREKSYYPRLCLLQVANDDLVACIDPIRLPDIEGLLSLLYDPSVVKVLHAARQDMEIFYHLRGTVPRPLFDTQIAAALLGYGVQIGYASLVREMLGVELHKSHSRTDWSLRPLEPEQLRYAADDVRYLRELYREQRRMLQELGRMEWLQEDFAQLEDPATYEYRADEAWSRIRGHQQLRGVQLAVLRALAGWREEQARRHDRPRKWLLRDDVLLELARRQPGNHQALARIRGLEEGTLRRRGSELLALIREARELPEEQWPRSGERSRLTTRQEGLVEALAALVRLVASESGISPASLATRRDLERLAAGEEGCAVMRGWRRQLCGARLERFLAGRSRLLVEYGQLAEHPVST